MPVVGYVIASTQKAVKGQATSATTDPVPLEPLLNNDYKGVSGKKNFRDRYRHNVVELTGHPLHTFNVESNDATSVSRFEVSNFTNTAFITALTITGSGGDEFNGSWRYGRVIVPTNTGTINIQLQSQN